MGNTLLTHNISPALLNQLLELGEGAVPTIYWNPGDDPTVGYGYNLETQPDARAEIEATGVSLTPDELANLNNFLDDLQNGAFTDAKGLLPDVDSITLSQTEQLDLLVDIENTSPTGIWHNISQEVEDFSGTQELAAIEDLDYNSPNRGATAAQYLIEGNRAEAWFYIRFLSNGPYNRIVDGTPKPSDAGIVDGIAARHYMESQVLDLYGSDVDPSGAGTPDFTSVSTSQALNEITAIFQTYSQYYFSIIEYENALGEDVSGANSKYISALSNAGISTIESTDSAMMPAFDYLSTTFAEGVYIPGDPNDPNQQAQHQGSNLKLDQFNIYAEPVSSEGQDNLIVSLPTNSYSGNYIIIGSTEQETLIGSQGRSNVLIAPDGDDTIAPGSVNDVVWGAPSGGDQSGNAIPGSILNISGTLTGTVQLYSDSISLNETNDKNGVAELDVIGGGGTLKTFYITTIIGGNGLSTLDIPNVYPAKTETVTFTHGTDGTTTIQTSEGLDIVTEGFTNFVLGNGPMDVTINGAPYAGGGSVLGSTPPADSFILQTGNGADVVADDALNTSIVFGTGNDTLTHAGAGSLVEAGTGTDTFDVSNDVLVTGVTPQDRIAYDGNDIYGALAWNTTQGGWAYNNYSYGVAYGLNKNGDLVIKTPGANPAYMYVANYVGGPGIPQADSTADIFVGVASEHAYGLLSPHPSVNFVWSQFNLANSMFKVDEGYSYWPGADPLVLDLAGNGLDLIGESEVSPVFDIYQDGFAVHTGWVKPDDGLLVWDDNGTYELLGANGESGFAALAAAAGIDFDSLNGGGLGGTVNSSATITSASSIFSQLYVWQDLNGNGVMDPGELESLSQAGIASISLNATAQTDDFVAGNTITATSTFTYTNGTTAQIADVSFLTDNFNSQYTGSTAVSTAAAAEPNLKGYGTLTDLRVAMTLDPSLITMVTNILPTLSVVNLDTLRDQAMPIFTAWADAVPLANTELAGGNHTDLQILITSENGIPTVTDYAYQTTGTDANGNSVTYWALASGNPILGADGNVIAQPDSAQFSAYETAVNTPANSEWETITGQELDFVERYWGDPITIGDGPSTPSGSLAVLGPALTAAWNALNLETVRLAMQGPLAPYFAGLSYDTASDTFDVTTDEQLTPMFKAIFAAAPTDVAGATAWINSWAPIINVVEGDLAPSQGLTATYGYLFASMVAAYEATSMPLDIKTVAEALGIPGNLIYDSGTTLAAASADANIIYAASGNQTIIGSGGPDNDVFGSNFGNDVINNQNTNQDPDILWFATLDPSDITASRSGDNLILTNNQTGAQITVLYEFIGTKPILTGQNLNPVTGAQQIVFADGTVWNFPDIMYNSALNTNGVNGTLIGATGPTVLDGDHGNTLMEGQSAGDVYLYDIGDGADTILQNTADILVTSPNIVSFGADITPQDVTFTRAGDSEDLTVEINDDPSDSLTVLGQFESTFTGVFGTVNLQQISDFSFADGISYTNAQVEQLVIAADEAIPFNTIYGFDGNDVFDPGVGGNDYMSGGNGDDTYIFGFGYGNDTIYDGASNLLSPRDDTVLFNAGIDPSDVTVERSGGSDNFSLVLSDGSTLTILDQFENIWAGPFGNIQFNQIDNFQFQDAANTDWTASDIEKMAIAYQISVSGGPVYGFWNGAYIDPGLGGNHLMVGEGSNNTYVFGLGYGDDTIDDSGNGSSTVLFNSDVDPSTVRLVDGTNGQDLTVVLADGSELDILGQFSYESALATWQNNQIGDFQFQDAAHTVWTNAQIEATLQSDEQAIPDNTIIGFFGGDTLDGYGGNETLIGVNGATTFLFGIGYGNEVVSFVDNRYYWTPRAVGIISFGAGITPGSLVFSSDSRVGNVTITVTGDTSDSLTLLNFGELLSPDWADSSLAGFQFSDGTFWSAAQITTILENDVLNGELPTQGSTLYGPFPNNYVDPGVDGNHDMVSAGGDNTYVFGLGYGHDTIQDSSSGGSEVFFNDDVNPSMARFIRGGSNFENLTILLSDGSELDILNEFLPTSYGFGDSFFNDVGDFQFQDASNTNISFSQLESNLIASEEASPNDNIYSFYGGDTLSGASGNDTFVGVNGANTILFGIGDGTEVLSLYDDGYYWAQRATANIIFGAGIDPNSITLLPDEASGYLTVQINGTEDSLTIAGYSGLLAGSKISFQFADGTVWSSDQITAALRTTALDAQLAVIGGPLNGPFPNNYVDPGLGGDHDMISAGEANTYVFGLGYGDDTLQDSSGGGSEILFNPGVDPLTTKLIRGGSDFFNLTVELADGSDLDIENEFLPTAYGFGDSLFNDVGYFQFQNATNSEWNFLAIENAVLAQEETTPGGTIYGFYGGSTLNGAAGGNTFVGINGANTILFGLGDSNEYLSLYDDGWYYAQRATAKVVFGQGINESALTFFDDGNSGNITVRVNGTSDSLTIENASGLLGQSFLSFQFYDGTVWNSAAIGAMVAASSNSVLPWYGSSTNTTLIGNDFAPNVFYAAPGGDSITFGSGPYQNTVDYDAGDGAVTISPNGGTGVIQFGLGITASDLVFEGNTASDGVTIILSNDDGNPTGDSIFVPDDFAAGEAIGKISFSDGSSLSLFPVNWTAAAGITSLTGLSQTQNIFNLNTLGDTLTFGSGLGGGQNTVEYAIGDGNVTINSNGGYGNIDFGAGITQNDIAIESDPAGDLTIDILDVNGNPTSDEIVIDNDLWISNWENVNFYYNSHINLLQFSDGSSLSITGNSTDTWIASSTITKLVGSEWSPNLFKLGVGGDTVTFGNGGNLASNWNTVDYNLGDGAASIDLNGGNGAIIFGAGVTQNDLLFQSDPAGDLTIEIADANGDPTSDKLVIDNDLWVSNWYNVNFYFNSHIESLQFADGSTLNITGGLTDTWFASAANTILMGSDWSANLFKLAPGNDTVTFGNGSNVASQQNTVDYNVGDGAVVLNTNGAVGTIVMGLGITQSDVAFQSDAAGDLTIVLLNADGNPTGDSITVPGDLWLGGWGAFESHIGVIQFADGSTLGINAGLTDTWIGTAQNTILVGSPWAANLFEAGPGGDTITFGNGGDSGNTSNTVDYNIGDGAVVLNPNGVNGTLVMGAGITKSDLQFQSDPSGDLVITLLDAAGNPTSDIVTIPGDLWLGGWGAFESHIGALQFADGSTLAINAGLTDTWVGTAQNTILAGSPWAANLFEAGPGGDTITFGNGGDSGNTSNTVDYNIGDGAVVLDTNGVNGTIVMGAGITQGDLRFQSDPAGDLTIILLDAAGNSTGDSITIPGDLWLGGWGAFESHIGVLQFADGSTLAINGGLTDTWVGTAQNTALVGSDWAANVFDAGPGDDTITFGNGSDSASSWNVVNYNIGDGAVVLNLNGVNGTIVMGAGITQNDLRFQSDAAGDLTIVLVDANGNPTGDSIAIDGDMWLGGWGAFETHIGVIQFADGSTFAITADLTDTWFGTGSDAVLTGSNWAGNIFDVGAGDDTVYFGAGPYGGSTNNEVLFGYGAGNVTVNTNGYDGGIDLAAGITASDFKWVLNANGSFTLSLLNANGTPSGDNLTFSSANNLSYLDLGAGSNLGWANLIMLGTPGNDTLAAWESSDTLDGLTGNDFLEGSSGSNTFVYKQGYGNDYIWVYNIGNSGSRILMGPGITQSDLTFSRAGGGPNWDLLINVAGAGSIQISADLAYRNIQEIDFANGSTMSLMGNLTYSAAAAGQTVTPWMNGDTLASGGFANVVLAGSGDAVDYLFDAGDGEVTISNTNGASQLDFGAGVSATRLQITFDAAGDLLIGDGIADDQVQIDNMYTNAAAGIVDAVFADGTTLSSQQLLNIMLSEQTAQITGVVAGQQVTDEASLNPFSSVTISGGGVSDSVLITLTGTSGVATDSDGTLSGTGLTKTGTGLYTLSGATPASLTTELEALTFTPTAHQVAPGSTVATTIDLGVTQNGLTSTNTATSIIATAVNDAPVIGGAVANQAITDETTLKPLSAVTITDPDYGVTDSMTITLTGTSGVATDADGTLSGTGLTKTGTGLYTLSGATPASLTSELEALTFTPTAHQVAPGSTVATGIKLSVTQGSLTSTNTTASIIATAVNDAPVIGGAVANQAITDETTLKPLSAMTITDPDFGATDSVTITLTGTGGLATDTDGTLAGTGLTKTGTGLYTLSAATPASLTSELDALTFTPTPHQVAPGSTVATTIGLGVTQNGLTSTNTATSIIATAVNDAPVIGGAVVGQAVTDEATLEPLSAVTITDPDYGATDIVLITLTGTSGVATDADGTLSGAGLTKTGTGLYTLSAATPASLTSELAALSFTPMAHQVAPGSTVTTLIDLGVTQNGLTSTNTATSIIATAVNDAPTISGAIYGQGVMDESSFRPFSGVAISDPDYGVTDSVTITLTGTSTIATDADGTIAGTGVTKIGTGLYTLSAATPASLTSELDALVFTPVAHQVAPGSTVATNLKLSVSQGSLTTTNTVTSIIATAVNDAPTITGAAARQLVTDQSTLKPLSSVTISDPDYGVTDSVTITMTANGGVVTDADGTLSGTGLTKIGTGLYTLAAATPANVTSELDALVFTPTAHQVAPGGTVTTMIDLGVTQNGLTSTNTVTSIIATAVNNAPTISGAVSGQAAGDEVTVSPFFLVTVSDQDYGVTDNAVITLTGSGGVATDADGTLSGAGLTKTGTGVYSLSAVSPASLTSELESLRFVPTLHQVSASKTVATSFDMIVTQGGAATPNTSTTVIITAVSSGGSITVSAGQSTNAIAVYGGGVETLLSGGKANATAVSSGGRVIVSSGGVASSIVVSNGGSTTALNDGLLSAAVVKSGGSLLVSSGGYESGTTVSSGGKESIFQNGQSTSATVSASGNLLVSSGGTAAAADVTSAGTLTLFGGGTASAADIASGGTILVSGGITSRTTILAGGTETVFSGGTLSATSVIGGSEIVSSGGKVVSAVLTSGGHETVYMGGVASATTVGTSGTLLVSSGGVLSGPLINSGGIAINSSGGVISALTVNSGGAVTIAAGATISGDTISAGGMETLSSGSTIVGSISFSGANATLALGGTVMPTNVISGFDPGSITSDQIILTSSTYSSKDSITLGASNVLSIDINGTISTLHLDPTVSYAGHSFILESNSSNQLLIVDPLEPSDATSAKNEARGALNHAITLGTEEDVSEAGKVTACLASTGLISSDWAELTDAMLDSGLLRLISAMAALPSDRDPFEANMISQPDGFSTFKTANLAAAHGGL